MSLLLQQLTCHDMMSSAASGTASRILAAAECDGVGHAGTPDSTELGIH